jgi:hypothetical protein
LLIAAFTRLYNWLINIFNYEPVHLAIVRRYQDAQGHNVGELYLYGVFAGVGSCRMIGCSLDSLPLDLTALSLLDEPDALDLEHDFLAPMAVNTLRVGAAEPKDNDAIRNIIRRIPRRNIRIVLQNRFVEHILERKQALNELQAWDEELGI